MFYGEPRTVFSAVIDKEIGELEKKIMFYNNRLNHTTGDSEQDEIERIVFTAVLSYLQSEAESLRAYKKQIEDGFGGINVSVFENTSITEA